MIDYTHMLIKSRRTVRIAVGVLLVCLFAVLPLKVYGLRLAAERERRALLYERLEPGDITDKGDIRIELSESINDVTPRLARVHFDYSVGESNAFAGAKGLVGQRTYGEEFMDGPPLLEQVFVIADQSGRIVSIRHVVAGIGGHMRQREVSTNSSP